MLLYVNTTFHTCKNSFCLLEFTTSKVRLTLETLSLCIKHRFLVLSVYHIPSNWARINRKEEIIAIFHLRLSSSFIVCSGQAMKLFPLNNILKKNAVTAQGGLLPQLPTPRLIYRLNPASSKQKLCLQTLGYMTTKWEAKTLKQLTGYLIKKEYIYIYIVPPRFFVLEVIYFIICNIK